MDNTVHNMLDLEHLLPGLKQLDWYQSMLKAQRKYNAHALLFNKTLKKSTMVSRCFKNITRI
ncbi:TPA: hypothetical protein QCU24_002463 [Bacillus cereus]|nr:hypothetical protein [Bacillus cereus]